MNLESSKPFFRHTKYVEDTVLFAPPSLIFTPDRRQSKTLLTIDERGSKIVRKGVFDWHLSPVDRRPFSDKWQLKTLF